MNRQLARYESYVLRLTRRVSFVGNIHELSGHEVELVAEFKRQSDDDREKSGITFGGGYGAPYSSPFNADEFDEIAPSGAEQVGQWLRDVLVRRAGVVTRD